MLRGRESCWRPACRALLLWRVVGPVKMWWSVLYVLRLAPVVLALRARSAEDTTQPICVPAACK